MRGKASALIRSSCEARAMSVPETFTAARIVPHSVLVFHFLHNNQSSRVVKRLPAPLDSRKEQQSRCASQIDKDIPRMQ